MCLLSDRMPPGNACYRTNRRDPTRMRLAERFVSEWWRASGGTTCLSSTLHIGALELSAGQYRHEHPVLARVALIFVHEMSNDSLLRHEIPPSRAQISIHSQSGPPRKSSSLTFP